MPCYEIIEHTADIGFTARGEDLSRAFECAAKALWDLIAANESRPEEVRLTFEINSIDREGVLVGFLSHLLLLFETERFLGQSASVAMAGQTKLMATVEGIRLGEDESVEGYHVKGVSYHMIEVVDGTKSTPAHVSVILDV